MNQPNHENVFSCGLELADVVLASGLLHQSLEVIHELDLDSTKKSIRTTASSPLVAYKAFDANKFQIIAFSVGVAGPSSVPSLTLETNPPEFNFLQIKNRPFSINEEAIKLFRSLSQDADLFQLKNPSKPLIITGHSEGGWVASLYCLWLLYNINQSNDKLPICITFGSPLLGDDGLCRAIQSRSGWYPRFLHVVSDGDVIPRTFLSSTANNSYKPFGTFLVCSSSSKACACFEDPDSVLSVLAATGGSFQMLRLMDYGNLLQDIADQMIVSNSNGVSQPHGFSQMPKLMDYENYFQGISQLHELAATGGSSLKPKVMDYGKLLQDLSHQMIVSTSNGISQLHGSRGDPLRAGIILRLDAIGVTTAEGHTEEDSLITNMERRERKNYHEHMKRISETDKKLNEMKVNLAHLEWYKKISSTELPMGYYDCYKKKPFWRDIHVVKYTRALTKYWEEVVNEAETKPPRLGAPLPTRLLYGGANYRKMVEPLDIADHYKRSKVSYRKEGRSKHYKLLETWQHELERGGYMRRSDTRDRAATMTQDSCFWADVEEAIMLTRSLKNGEAVEGPEESPIQKLKNFEDHVMGLIDGLAVSPEIFLEESTFMQWWKEYQRISKPNPSSRRRNPTDPPASKTLTLRSFDPRDREMNQPNHENVFSCGLQSADLMLGSGLLHRSLEVIHELDVDSKKKNIRTNSSSPLFAYKTCDANKFQIIAFSVGVAGRSSVLSSPTLEPNPPEFNFLRIKNSPFSINEEAIKLFRSLSQDADLFQLKNPSKPLIITGHSEGGWIASLYCLWLLYNISQSNDKLPICITFGSPLLGDDGLCRAIQSRSGWYPRFLHVVSDGDLIPRTFLSSTANNSYKPFGTFLVCSSSSKACACFEDPDSVLSVLVATGGSFQMLKLMDYGNLLQDITDQMMVFNSNGVSQLHGSRGDPLRAGIILCLDAIGVTRAQEHMEEDDLITEMERQERKIYREHVKRISETDRRLNEMKVNLARLEWYKKISSTELPMGYYDCYKKKPFWRDIHVVKYSRALTKYWKDVVNEAETNPPKLGTPLPTRLLYGGANYRKMVEPLDIADHYKQSNTSYRKEGRSKHYKLLETWQHEMERGGYTRKSDSRDRAATMTQDSCFWADVEDAIILTNSLKNGEAVGGPEESHIQKLEKFEDHMMSLIDGLAVSPEIFLEKSTLMQWWKEYQKIPDRNPGSRFANFMKNKLYQRYI
ncbi:hypothetical protein NE237_020864 [Protea cynaroides]|uniref:Uncharacterized protein n=1 Tax=Protea cynaroides TaxID=273540 RepID=A0A9Q0HC19_9MAGN|nr:hypothetical protein NE237_020864 [Protea cynaroides]